MLLDQGSTGTAVLDAQTRRGLLLSIRSDALWLNATVENLLDALQEGKQVDFGELGKFRLHILNEGAESLEKFTSTNITGVSIQYIPGEDLKNVFAGLEFQPVATRKAQQAVLRAEKAGETTVDISKKPAAGGGDSESPDEI